MPPLYFHVKAIRWSPYEQTLPILLQDTNGPCPLIALVNTLILTNDIEQRTVGMQGPADTSTGLEAPDQEHVPGVSAEAEQRRAAPVRRMDVAPLRSLLALSIGATVEVPPILSSLGDILLSLPATDPAVLNVLLESLPLLHTGLDVNPNLVTGGFGAEEMASQIFCVFGLNFLHGWCREPTGDPAADAVFESHQTFEAIQEFLLTSNDSASEKTQAEAWLQANATQLTAHGLRLIDQQMQPDSLAIFFRNNHFLTLYKAQNRGLYLLITDDVFLKRATYVWQSINLVSGGDDLYFAGDFTPLMEGSALDEAAGAEESLLFAKRLQEQEDADYAKILQQNYEKRAQTLPFGAGNGAPELGAPEPGAPGTEEKKARRRLRLSELAKDKPKKKDACVMT